MVTQCKQTYHCDHFDMYRNITSLCCVTGNNSVAGQLYFKTNEFTEEDQIRGYQMWGQAGNGMKMVKRQKLPFLSSRDVMHNMINIVNTARSYIKKLNEFFSHHKKKFFYLVLYLYKMMDVYQIIINYSHFRMHVSQIIMLQSLNLYSALCQFYLNKTERKIILK